MDKQQKKDALDMAQAKSNIANKKRRFAKDKLPAEVGNASVNANMTITLSDDYLESGVHQTLPDQLKCMCRLLMEEFDGQATLGELDKAWWSSKYIDSNGGIYTQGVLANGKAGKPSFLKHYFSGSDAKPNLTSRKGALTNEQYKKYIAIA
tara:strand:+ start:82 stop:534 length:453 start_codon:yes stop_codon:yes gene_type:complete